MHSCKNQHVHPDHNDDDHHPQDPFPKGKVWMLIVRSVMGASNLCVHFYGVKHMPIGGIIFSNVIISTQISPIQKSNPSGVIGNQNPTINLPKRIHHTHHHCNDDLTADANMISAASPIWTVIMSRIFLKVTINLISNNQDSDCVLCVGY